jgi:hypothetical protein
MNYNTTIRKQFFSSIKRGTGEAYIIFQNHPKINFSDLIIKGAIKNFAYDEQCEGSRAKYIYGLIKKDKWRLKIIAEVLKNLEIEKEDYYSLDQMCDLAILFYKAGHINAMMSLHKRFDKNGIGGYESCGQDQIIELGGLVGLLKVAEFRGKMLLKNKNDWEDSWIVDEFQRKNKKIDVCYELKMASKINNFIAAYYNSIVQNKINRPRIKKIKRFSYELIKRKIDNNKLFIISGERANELTEDEVRKLANEFLKEKDSKRKESYLRFFSASKFPFDYKPILKIATGRNPRGTRLVEFALKALGQFSNKEIRNFAITRIKNVENPCNYLCLLICNYKKGDNRLLSEIANRSDNYDYVHSIVDEFVNIYKANPTPECKQPLELIYKKMNCGIHRIDIINLLSKNRVLSENIINELQYDSYNPVRKLFRKIKQGE